MKSKRSFPLMLGLLLAGILFSTMAAAIPQGATNTTGPVVRAVINDPALNYGQTAGNIVSVNLDANSQTNHWFALYGNVSGHIQLRDDVSKKTVFDWSANGADGKIKNDARVIATTNNVLNLAGLSVGSASTYDTVTGVGGASDSFASTFTLSSPANYKIGTLNLGSFANAGVNLNYYDNNRALRNDGQNLGQMVLLNDTTSFFVFATTAKSLNGVTTYAYDNATMANYEALLFSNNYGNNNPTNYNIFLELT